ncbi:SWIM zinc finger family protein [Streptomyces sp. NPDC005574]|uniref:SWIM zinc finger family protein n=1 Tax=Streptomyces sp. NPDC005574 TaxID=3156891 RepID=UPI0033AC0C6B
MAREALRAARLESRAAHGGSARGGRGSQGETRAGAAAGTGGAGGGEVGVGRDSAGRGAGGERGATSLGRTAAAGGEGVVHDGGGGSAGGERRPASPAARPRRGARGGTADVRGRAVRELLGDAFRMPDDTDETGEQSAGAGGAGAAGRASRERGAEEPVTSPSVVPAGAGDPSAAATPEPGGSVPAAAGTRAGADAPPAPATPAGTSAPGAPASPSVAVDTADAAHDVRAADTGAGADAPPAPATPAATSAPGAPASPSVGVDTADAAHDVRAAGTRAGADAPPAPATPAGTSAPGAPASPSVGVDTADAAHDVRAADPAEPETPSVTAPRVSVVATVAAEPTAPAGAPAPHSMAAPGRDGELRRTFAALPGGPAPGGQFAETWWGNAWVTALEEGALDAGRLVRGRAYAERGHVDAITVTPGLVLAYVRGGRPRPYRVQVRLRTLGDTGWERFLDAAADRPGHIAALLDKELPQSLADCGAPLLPGPGDLEPRCSCPDSGHPCKHAAALCYQTARLLDADPFVLLLLRGRGERDLLDALSRRSATRAARAAQDQEPAPLPGVRATEALAPRQLPPLPAPLAVPPHPGQPPVYPAAPGGPDPFALDQLATDAAARAHALLATGRDPVGELTLWQDAVRLAAARPGSGLTAGTRALYSSLASAAGRTPAELARAVAAWRQGGLEGLGVLDEPWDPPAGRFDRARPLLLAADLPAFRPWRNHLTHPRGHVQLRLGRDGLWYAYESEPGRDDWWPRGTPDLDPVGALTGLGAANDL